MTLRYNVNVQNNRHGGSFGFPDESMTRIVALILPWLVSYTMYLINLRRILPKNNLLMVALVKAATMIQAGKIVCSCKDMHSLIVSLIDTVKGFIVGARVASRNSDIFPKQIYKYDGMIYPFEYVNYEL